MCEPGKDNNIEREIWHAMTALMQPYAPIEGKEGEMFMPDKDKHVAHAYEHLRKAHDMAWAQEHPES